MFIPTQGYLKSTRQNLCRLRRDLPNFQKVGVAAKDIVMQLTGIIYLALYVLIDA
jgi:hypothetical protein